MRTLPMVLLFALPVATLGALSPVERQRNIDSFEHVWKTVHDKHWDPKYNGVDWQGVHDELRPRIENADSMPAARGVIQQMLGRLKQSHFGIISGEAYDQMRPGPGSREGVTGIDVRLMSGRMLVTSIQSDSPAAALGVHGGWELVAVDGQELAPVIARISNGVETSAFRAAAVRASILYRLGGEPGGTVSVRFRDGSRNLRDVEIRRVRPRGLRVEFGFLPPMYVWAEARKLGDDIAYLALNMFMDPEHVMKATSNLVESCKGCKGFVIDLRGNPGGVAGMAMGLAGWFVDQKGLRLGTLSTRDTSVNLVLNPRPTTYGGPLAILVDGCTGSTAEIFSGGMKDIKRARVFGSRTMGVALPSVIEKLSNGDGFQYAFANYVSEGGQPLEGVGVLPDVDVELTADSLLAGRDTVLDAALEWIRHEKPGGRP
jgi:carboxyl-terminal processing protease